MNYRDNVYDRGEEMLRRLGTFWYYIFNDQDTLAQFYKGSYLEAGQTYLNFLEAMAAISRLEIPVFHQENWYYLTILESDLRSAVAHYGDGLAYGDGHFYGVRSSRTTYTAGIPDNMMAAQFIYNRIIQPSLTYTSGMDFAIDRLNHSITFREDPFANDLIPKRNIMDTQGNVVDREAGMWVYNGMFDLQYIWIHWGYILQVFMQSSTYYKDFVNALADSYVMCPTLKSTQAVIAALTGVALVIEPVEVVEQILTPPGDVLQIVTDKHVYEFVSTAVPIVTVGQTVYGGDSLTNAVEIIELIHTLPTAAQLPGISVGSNWLVGAYIGELLFENKTVPLQYWGLVDGYVKVTFEVSGFPADVEKFWDDCHARGVLQGKVLADYLDTRATHNTPPLPENLPATVNPLQFMLANLMKNNVFLVVLRPSQFPGDSPGVSYFNYLRRAMVPHTTYLVYVEVDAGLEYIDYSDALSMDDAISFIDIPDGVVIESIDASTFVEEAVLVRPVKEC